MRTTEYSVKEEKPEITSYLAIPPQTPTPFELISTPNGYNKSPMFVIQDVE